MYYAVGKPSHDAEEGTGVCGQNIAQVGTVEDVFKSGQDSDPDGWAPA